MQATFTGIKKWKPWMRTCRASPNLYTLAERGRKVMARFIIPESPVLGVVYETLILQNARQKKFNDLPEAYRKIPGNCAGKSKENGYQ
jgi:hypothetical protein